ncbi:MAG: hypothetical protein R3B48_02845 [Kofleriaceae bacterium]
MRRPCGPPLPPRRLGGLLTAALLLGGAPACADPEPPRFAATFALQGTWTWSHVVEDPGLRRLERERWRWRADPEGDARGEYVREVTVRSEGAPFACNQDTSYTQRARFDVRARAVDGAIEIVETGYRVEPSPCDHGFRKLGTYRVLEAGARFVVLGFAEGHQTLRREDAPDPSAEPLADPWEAPGPVAGAWIWTSARTDERGLAREEEERWELALPEPAGGLADEHAKVLDAIYVRRVTVRTRDGSALPCAEGSRYAYEDRYVLEGRRRGALIALRETAVAASAHPCLRAHPRRTLDTGMMEPLGAYLIITWRGKRRQVLRRP